MRNENKMTAKAYDASKSAKAQSTLALIEMQPDYNDLAKKKDRSISAQLRVMIKEYKL